MIDLLGALIRRGHWGGVLCWCVFVLCPLAFAEGKGVSKPAKLPAVSPSTKAAAQAAALSDERTTSQQACRFKSPVLCSLQANCEVGDLQACFRLGWRFKTGLDVPRDRASAWKWFRRSCDIGRTYSRSCHQLGAMLGWSQSEERAQIFHLSFVWAERECAAGIADGCYVLGLSYQIGRSVRKDLTQAVRFYEKGCKRKHSRACYRQALLQERVCAKTQRNPKEHWRAFYHRRRDKKRRCREKLFPAYQQACRHGEFDACEVIASTFLRRRTTEARLQAITLYKQLCASGRRLACARVAALYRRSKDLTEKKQSGAFYRKACDLGRSSACVQAARFYANSDVPAAQRKVRPLFRKACDLGQRSACWILVRHAERQIAASMRSKLLPTKRKGRSQSTVGVVPRPATKLASSATIKKLCTWSKRPGLCRLRTDCERGLSSACFRLGWHHLKGTGGLSMNYRSAKALFLRGCQKRDASSRACHILGVLALRLRQKRAGMRWLRRSFTLGERECREGQAHGCHVLASLYQFGRGVQRDVAKAASLYKKSCRLGDARACVSHVKGRWLRCRAVKRRKKESRRAFYRRRWTTRRRCTKEMQLGYQRACHAGALLACLKAMEQLRLRQAWPRIQAKVTNLSLHACAAGGTQFCGKALQLWAYGRGAKDTKKSIRFHRKACAMGLFSGCWWLLLRQQRLKRTFGAPATEISALFALYEKACNLGKKQACARLGQGYQGAKRGTIRWKKAMHFHRKACTRHRALRGYKRANTESVWNQRQSCWLWLRGEQKKHLAALKLSASKRDAHAKEVRLALGMACPRANTFVSAICQQRLCEWGVKAACSRAASLYDKIYVREQRAKRFLAAMSKSLYRKGCDASNVLGCRQGGEYFARRLLYASDKRAKTAMIRLYTKACQWKDKFSCQWLGREHSQKRSRYQVPYRPQTALAFFKRACQFDARRACHTLGQWFSRGLHVQQSATKAYRYHQRACQLQHWESCVVLGVMHEEGRGCQKDIAKARGLYEQMCRRRITHGCFRLGLLYEAGLGLQKDVKRSLALYEQSCRRVSTKHQGLGSRCLKVAKAYETGQVLSRDMKKARVGYQRACHVGFGCVRYGRFLEQGLGGRKARRQALDAYIKACARGERAGCERCTSVATSILAAKKRFRWRWVIVRRQKQCTQRSCALGNAQVCLALGDARSKHAAQFSRDLRFVRKMYGKACDAGLVQGCIRGAAYEKELRAPGKMRAFQRKACALGHGQSCFALGVAARLRAKKAQKQSKALLFYRKACVLKHGQGCFDLGVMHLFGRGVGKDTKKAQQYFAHSCRAGYGEGCKNLGLIHEKATNGVKNCAKAGALYRRACRLGVKAACAWKCR